MSVRPSVGQAKGPQYNVARAIQSFLGQMAERGIPLGSAVIKELMQNADDARATELTVLLDERHPPEKLNDTYHRLLLPALLVRNNAPFRKFGDPDYGGIDDFEALCDVAKGHKRFQSTAAGRFGIGFNSVYFFTDTPVIFSRKEVHVFDPLHLIFEENGWKFPLEAFPSSASNAGPIKTVLDWALPKAFLGSNKAFGELAQSQSDYQQAALRLPLREEVEGARSLYPESLHSSELRCKLLSGMSEQASRSLLFLKYLARVQFGILNEGGIETAWVVEATENSSEFFEFLENVQMEARSPEVGRRLKCPFYDRSIVMTGTDGDTRRWEFLVTHTARFDQEEISELRKYLDRNEERAVPWVSIAIPKNPQSVRFEGEENPAWRVFLPLLEAGPCACALNGAFFVGPSRQQAEFRNDGSDEALRKTNWNKCLVRNVLVPELRELSVDIACHMPLLVKETPQDYLRLFPKSFASTSEPVTLSQYVERVFSEEPWCLKCYDLWDVEFELFIGGDQETMSVEMIPELIADYKDRFRHLSEANRKFIPWKLGDALRSRVGEGSGISIQRSESVDVVRAVLEHESPPEAKDLGRLLDRFIDQDTSPSDLEGLWAFKAYEEDLFSRYQASSLYIIGSRESEPEVHKTLRELEVTFESCQWVDPAFGFSELDTNKRQGFANLHEADDRAAINLLKRVKDGDVHDRVSDIRKVKSIVGFLCRQDPDSLPSDLRLGFLVKTAAMKLDRRPLGTIFIRPELPSEDDEAIWEGLLRRTFAEVDPTWAAELQVLLKHAPSMRACLHSLQCSLEVAKAGNLLGILHRAIQKNPSSLGVFRDELNRREKEASLLRPAAYKAARAVLEEGVGRWEKLDESHKQTLLLLPIHRAAEGSLIPLLEIAAEAYDPGAIKSKFFLQSEDDLRDAPISLPECVLLHSERTTHAFYRRTLGIRPRDRGFVLEECLKQVGKETAPSNRLLEYIAKYYADTLDELEKEQSSSDTRDADNLRKLMADARIVPCLDKMWRKATECLRGHSVAAELERQGWNKKEAADLTSKLAYPKAVASFDSQLSRLIDQVRLPLDSVEIREIPLLALTSEHDGFTLTERAKVVDKNAHLLPSSVPKRARVLAKAECISFCGKATLSSVKLVNFAGGGLPQTAVKMLTPNGLDIPSNSRNWNLSGKRVQRIFEILGVPECSEESIQEELLSRIGEVWAGLNTQERLSTLEYISKKGLSARLAEEVQALDAILVDLKGEMWKSPEDVVSPELAGTNPPNMRPDQIPEKNVSRAIEGTWNEWCGLRTLKEVFRAVLQSTQSASPSGLSVAWKSFCEWLARVISGPLGGKFETDQLEEEAWVLSRKGEDRNFSKPSQTVNHPGNQVLAREFWVMDGQLPKALASRIQNFAELPPIPETIASISNCLAHSASFPAREVLSVYQLVQELCVKEEGLKTCWSQHSRAEKVYRLFRQPEVMVTEHQFFLGNDKYREDFGSLIYRFAGKFEGAETLLTSVRKVYRNLGVSTEPKVLHALHALSELAGGHRSQKSLYARLEELTVATMPELLEKEAVPDFRILTCSGTFEPVSRVYKHDVLNRASLLSERSRTRVIDDRDPSTLRLVRCLEKGLPGIIKSLSDVARVELVRTPRKIAAAKSAVTVIAPWEDWFKQLAAEGSNIREKICADLGVVPVQEPFKLIPVERIAVQYALPDGSMVVPTDSWEGPPVLHDGKCTLFALKGFLEKDYIGKSEDLGLFDSKVASEVAGLLLSRGIPQGATVDTQGAVGTVQRIVQETLERPGVFLEQLRQEREYHFYHQYQDQTADPEFAECFAEYQRLSESGKKQRKDLREKMNDIIQTKFVAERRSQIKGYGYDEFSVFAELVQNAEDAYSQRLTLRLEDPPQKAVVFRYEKDKDGIALVVEHWGRPFNLWRYGNVEEPSFRHDVEGVLRSSGSFKPHARSASESDKPIGRFGLGFKSVYLITDEPRIHSGQWHFEIRSACIPWEVQVPNDFSHDLTRILLPLAHGVVEETDPTGARLANLTPFLRHVREVSLKNSFCETVRTLRVDVVGAVGEDKAGIVVELVKISGVGVVRGGEIRMIRLRRAGSPEQLGIYISPDGLPSNWGDVFEKDIFAVLPLSIHLGCGLGVSNLFELQSGRTHLIDPEGNSGRFKAVASLLRGLPEVVSLCANKNTTARDVMLRFWTLLRWNRGDRDALTLRRELASVLCEMAQDSKIVPTLDPSKCVSLGSETVFSFTGVPNDFAGELIREGASISIEGRNIRLSRKNVVPELFRQSYEMTARASGLTGIKSPRAIGWIEIGEIIKAKNLFAERPNLLSAMARSLPEEALSTVKKWLSECLLKAENGSTDIPRNLLPHRFPGCEYLPARLMKRLHAEYDSDSTELLKRAELPSRPALEQLSSWVTRGLKRSECIDLLRYLGEAGRWRRDFYSVGELLVARWFEGNGRRVTTNEAFQQDLIPENIIVDQPFRAWLGIRTEGEEPTTQSPVIRDAKDMLNRIYEWWEGEQDFYQQEYEGHVYPEGRLPALRSDFCDRDDNERRGWLTLLLLGCSHTMGRTRSGQHRTFLESCEQRGWLRVFSDPDSRAEDWIRVLEEYLEEQVEDAPYYQWMKQFISIYQVSKYLDGYVNSLLEIDRYAPGAFSIDHIREPMASPEQQGGGYAVPSLRRALGIGICFILREMNRMGLVRNPDIQRYCYVPSKRVRDIFTDHLGLSSLLIENGIQASQLIHGFLTENLGAEKATFRGSFDLPFLTLADNPSLYSIYLAPK